jgi:hypothetical protein
MAAWLFRRRIILGLTIAIFLLVAALQPFFLGNEKYFGVDARIICSPIAFVVLPFLGIHLYINRHLLKNLVKTASQKPVKLIVIVLMAGVGVLDISSGWRSVFAGQSEYLLMPMWAWSWLFTLLIVVHVCLHRRAFAKYFQRRKTGTANSDISPVL